MKKHYQAKWKSKEDLQDFREYLEQYDWSAPLKVDVSPVSSTLDYKALFWLWMHAIAKSLSGRGHPVTPEQIHDLVCHKFLGYTEPMMIGKTRIKSALKTLTYPQQLDRGQFFNLMREIEIWASDLGVALPDRSSQYTEDKEAGNK